MKKLMALMLCLSMVFGTVAFAAENELNKDVMEGQTTVSLTIAPEANEFVVVIPATVTIDPETQEGTLDVTLKAGWKLVSSNSLKVRIKEFENGIRSGTAYDMFTLTTVTGATASYRIYPKAATSSSYSETALNNRNYTGTPNLYWEEYNLISITKATANTADQTASLKLKVMTLPTEPGEYSDTITFAITLE